MDTVRLGVNVDHIATVRQARRGTFPDPVEAACVCEHAGANSIVCHLREDRRHINDEDVRRLKARLSVHLNLEMSIAPDIVEAALAVHPSQVTLVPERRQELTTEGGLDVIQLSSRLKPLIRRFQEAAIEVSLFIDPIDEQIIASLNAGATIIELHTGRFAETQGKSLRAKELEGIIDAAYKGRELGLSIAAGHGLDYDTVGAIAGIADVEEVNIGFSIISRALSVGLERAVSEMVGLLQRQDKRAQQTA